MKWTVGVDEVGRGPLAGPVAVGAVAATPAGLRRLKGIKESKQLSKAARERWVRIIAEMDPAELRVAVSFVSAGMIDKIGIAASLRIALARSMRKLGIPPLRAEVLLDGGLRAPKEYKRQKTIIRGDEKVAAIAAASVVAKVRRDRRMARLDRIFPGYGFALHAGYGTKKHIAAIRKYGPTPLHRRSFLGNIFSRED